MQDDFRMIIGICVEPNTSLEFSIHTFIQPLYIPFPYLLYSLGEWFGHWNRADLSAALPVIQKCYDRLSSYDSIATVIDKINNHQLTYFGSEISRYEFLAYSYMVINKYDHATDYLKKIVDFEKDKDAPGWSWMQDIIESAKKMLDLIAQENWAEIRNQLLDWQKVTMTGLKLPD